MHNKQNSSRVCHTTGKGRSLTSSGAVNAFILSHSRDLEYPASQQLFISTVSWSVTQRAAKAAHHHQTQQKRLHPAHSPALPALNNGRLDTSRTHSLSVSCRDTWRLSSRPEHKHGQHWATSRSYHVTAVTWQWRSGRKRKCLGPCTRLRYFLIKKKTQHTLNIIY